LVLNLDSLLPTPRAGVTEQPLFGTLNTVLLVARAGLIELVSRFYASRTGIDEMTPTETCRVRILDPGHANKDYWKRAVAASRSQTRARVDHFRLLFDVINGAVKIAESIKELYTVTLPGASVSVHPAGGGCPVHWSHEPNR